jgi:CheY-like chemotaxis protein
VRGLGSVLCIEDNRASLRLFAQIIKGHTPYEFIGASSSGEGLDLARSRGPDLILLDIGLPDMDGFEVLRQLRAQGETRDIPVIAISGNAMPLDIEKGASAGFLDYLTKPIEIVRLVISINAALAAEE